MAQCRAKNQNLEFTSRHAVACKRWLEARPAGARYTAARVRLFIEAGNFSRQDLQSSLVSQLACDDVATPSKISTGLEAFIEAGACPQRALWELVKLFFRRVAGVNANGSCCNASFIAM